MSDSVYTKLFQLKAARYEVIKPYTLWNLKGATDFSVTRLPRHGIAHVAPERRRPPPYFGDCYLDSYIITAQIPFPLDILSIITFPIVLTASKSSHSPCFARNFFFAP